MTTMAERLKTARKQAGLTQVQLAEKVGISQNAITKIEAGGETKYVTKLAEVLNVSPTWLQLGKEEVALVMPKEIHNGYSYPLISTVAAGNFSEGVDLADSEGYQEIDSELETKGTGFFLKVVGMSMEPKFSEGDLVLVDTGKKPKPGDYVVASVECGEATLKKYRELDELTPTGNRHFELIPLNPDWGKTSSLTKDIRIIGVAVEHRSYL